MIREGLKLPANPLDSAPDFVNHMRLDNDVVAVIVFGSAAQGMNFLKVHNAAKLDTDICSAPNIFMEHRQQRN